MNPNDTICALSTAPGRAGIAVVRVSGTQSLKLLRSFFVAKAAADENLPRQAVLGSIVDLRTGDELDEALATYFPGPHSYTGEDVVEFSLHGSPVLVAALLDGLCSKGARLAEPGEFTLRAFLNHRMDLSQAEAVADIIEATTLYQAQIAARQRSGELGRQLAPVKDRLIDIIVQLESTVEFVEEDLAVDTRDVLAHRLEDIRHELGRWIASFRQGRIIHDGFRIAIVGRPNVGKSSLFNELLSRERSIVTDVPGTTRDLVLDSTNIKGIPVHLVDTAGVRTSADKIEQLGVGRSLEAMADADAILLVVDTSRPCAPEDEDLKAQLEGSSCIVVMNKCDLLSCWQVEEKAGYAGVWPWIEVSAKTGARVEDLRTLILQHLFGRESVSRDGILVTHLRHCQCLEVAQKGLEHASRALRDGLAEEFALFDLRRALQDLGAITGETSVDDLLGAIFSRFCIGK
jgi:tRNA modification GTPase